MASKKILLVDDDELLASLLRYKMEKSGYSVDLAQNGEEVKEYLSRTFPDIIVSDVMMPRKDGFELCQTLKEDDRTSHIPIVLLTARSDVESRISGLQHGADAYLPKPFERKELLVRLDMLIKLRQRLQARYQQAEAPTSNADVAIQKEDAFIQKLRAIILDRIDDSELTVTILCELAGMSRSQLHNKVKALTGDSSSRFLRRVRLGEAQKLLLDPSLQIAEVAWKVGFNDPAYFTRIYVDEFGKTPSEARKSHF